MKNSTSYLFCGTAWLIAGNFLHDDAAVRADGMAVVFFIALILAAYVELRAKK